jgi:hypothetical protein
METLKIKALCDYLLGYWELEIDDDDDNNEFNEYFKNKYNVHFDTELNISSSTCWKDAHIELSNLLDENNSGLSKLLLGMVFVSSSRNEQNMKRVNQLLEELYKKI